MLFKKSNYVICMIFILLLSGCGTVEHNISLRDGYVPQEVTKVEVGEVLNETGETFDVDIEQLLTNALAEQLREEELLWIGSDEKKLLFISKIIEYEKGNAFKRWLLPGWGSTVLAIQCDIKEGGQLVGSVEARRTVSAGGGYTVGAWRTIFSDIAKDVAEELCSKIPSCTVTEPGYWDEDV